MRIDFKAIQMMNKTMAGHHRSVETRSFFDGREFIILKRNAAGQPHGDAILRGEAQILGARANEIGRHLAWLEGGVVEDREN